MHAILFQSITASASPRGWGTLVRSEGEVTESPLVEVTVKPPKERNTMDYLELAQIAPLLAG